MRVAFHNPWTKAAENQAFMSMAAAGRRIGVELFSCADEDDIEACRPDFVISVATSMAKITDFPTYLTVHEPKSYLLEQPARMRNLFSYDGYLTISGSLVRFIRDFTAGVGREEKDPGFFYPTPQVTNIRADWERIAETSALRVAYFGTNWNRRLPLLFRALDRTGVLSIHGPEGSWQREGYSSYAGSVPFDGNGPQRRYAECGLGLALMDERWRREDVVSNRIFEISSVGAVSICPDMPWIRKWFGDSVLYYDADRPAGEIAARITGHHAFCLANPDQARAMGDEARRIFETHFSAERVLANAVAYHERKMAERARRVADLGPPAEVTVVVRCGGRDIATVERAVNSIRYQTYGAFTVILAKYRPIDLSVITAKAGGAITAFHEFLIEGGKRATTLFAGVARVKTPYFAVLDDDDFWMSDHIETLFVAGRRIRDDFDMAFSGSIGFDHPILIAEALSCRRNILRFGFAEPVKDVVDVSNAVAMNAFVARADLLRAEMGEAPDLHTAEDSLLICQLASRSKPIFSWRPTAFFRCGATGGSQWQTDPHRADDEVSFALRVGLAWSPEWIAGPTFAALSRMWTEAKTKLGRNVEGEYLDRLLIGPAGRQTPHGIAAAAGVADNVSYGPQRRLPPGVYQLTFLLLGAPPGHVSGHVDVLVDASRVLFEWPIDREEVDVVFIVTPEMVNSRIEFRTFSNGSAQFTVSSVVLFVAPAGAQPTVTPPPPVVQLPPPPRRTLSRRIVGRLRRYARRALGI